jgi:hypothetical protein
VNVSELSEGLTLLFDWRTRIMADHTTVIDTVVFPYLARYLDVDDVLSLRLTCHHFLRVSNRAPQLLIAQKIRSTVSNLELFSMYGYFGGALLESRVAAIVDDSLCMQVEEVCLDEHGNWKSWWPWRNLFNSVPAISTSPIHDATNNLGLCAQPPLSIPKLSVNSPISIRSAYSLQSKDCTFTCLTALVGHELVFKVRSSNSTSWRYGNQPLDLIMVCAPWALFRRLCENHIAIPITQEQYFPHALLLHRGHTGPTSFDSNICDELAKELGVSHNEVLVFLQWLLNKPPTPTRHMQAKFCGDVPMERSWEPLVVPPFQLDRQLREAVPVSCWERFYHLCEKQFATNRLMYVRDALIETIELDREFVERKLLPLLSLQYSLGISWDIGMDSSYGFASNSRFLLGDASFDVRLTDKSEPQSEYCVVSVDGEDWITLQGPNNPPLELDIERVPDAPNFCEQLLDDLTDLELYQVVITIARASTCCFECSSILIIPPGLVGGDGETLYGVRIDTSSWGESCFTDSIRCDWSNYDSASSSSDDEDIDCVIDEAGIDEPAISPDGFENYTKKQRVERSAFGVAPAEKGLQLPMQFPFRLDFEDVFYSRN